MNLQIHFCTYFGSFALLDYTTYTIYRSKKMVNGYKIKVVHIWRKANFAYDVKSTVCNTQFCKKKKKLSDLSRSC